MKVLEAEGTSGPGFGFFPGLEPDSLAELVGRDLPRPAEVAVQFEAQPLLLPAGVGPQELPGGPGIPALALPPAGALGILSSRCTPMSRVTLAALIICMSSIPRYAPGSSSRYPSSPMSRSA